jgi:hypothetical protein
MEDTRQQQLDALNAEGAEVIQMWASGLVTLPELINGLKKIEALMPNLSGLICPTTGLRFA